MAEEGTSDREAPRHVALVTGASRGIGRAIAIRLASDGFAVGLLARSQPDLERVADEVTGAGGEAFVLPSDITDKALVADAVSRAIEKFGRVDVMVANAGIIRIDRLLDVTRADIDHIMSLNLYGVLYCIQTVAPVMIAQGGGKLLLANSISGLVGERHLTSYCLSKFALHGLAQCAARELAPYGITVNSFCPGIIATDMWTTLDRELGAVLGNAPGETIRERGAPIALGRLGQSTDVAGLVSYLASDDSNYMTGQSLVIDGGLIFR